jgi:hypothetical protein
VSEPLKRNLRQLRVKIMTRNETVANFVIGGLGSVGQGMLLAHALASYPFKILNYPPGEFFSTIGLVLAFASPVLSLLALRTFRSMRAPFVTAIPVVACPLIFFALFRLVFILSSYHYVSPGSDLVASSAIETGFIQLVLWLTMSGFVVGIACGWTLWLFLGSYRATLLKFEHAAEQALAADSTVSGIYL